MAFVYKPPHSQTYRIGYYDNDTQKSRSISAKTKDIRIAKKICKDFDATVRLNLNQDDEKIMDYGVRMDVINNRSNG